MNPKILLLVFAPILASSSAFAEVIRVSCGDTVSGIINIGDHVNGRVDPANATISFSLFTERGREISGFEVPFEGYRIRGSSTIDLGASLTVDGKKQYVKLIVPTPFSSINSGLIEVSEGKELALDSKVVATDDQMICTSKLIRP